MTSNDRYDSLFQFYAEPYGLDWKDLKAQCRAESNFNPMARSGAGAMGLMQFMLATFTEWSDRLHLASANPYNPEHSIQCGAAYMAYLRERYNGDQKRALAAYNFGLGNVDKTKPEDYPHETRVYVDRVERFRTDLA